jgi:hypothetical protein
MPRCRGRVELEDLRLRIGRRERDTALVESLAKARNVAPGYKGTPNRAASGATVATKPSLGGGGTSAARERTRSSSRCALYADPVAFWSDAVAKSAQKARPRTSLGRTYIAAGDLDQAMEQFRFALTLDRLDRAAQENLLFTWEPATRLDAPPGGLKVGNTPWTGRRRDNLPDASMTGMCPIP